jgi:hypothetical protein
VPDGRYALNTPVSTKLNANRAGNTPAVKPVLPGLIYCQIVKMPPKRATPAQVLLRLTVISDRQKGHFFMAQTRPADSDAVLLCSQLPDAAGLRRLTDILRPLGLVPERASSDAQSRLYSGADRHLLLQLEPHPMAAEYFPAGSLAGGANGTLLASHQAHIRVRCGDGPAPGLPCEDDDAIPTPFELLQISYRAARALADNSGTRGLCWMHSGVMLNLAELRRLPECCAPATAPAPASASATAPAYASAGAWSLLARPQALSCGRVRLQGARQITGSEIDLLTGDHPQDVIAQTGLRALQIFAGSQSPSRDALAPASWGQNARGTFIVRLPVQSAAPAPKSLTTAQDPDAAPDIGATAMRLDPAPARETPHRVETAMNARPLRPHSGKQQLTHPTPLADPDQRQAPSPARSHVPTHTPTRTRSGTRLQEQAHLRPPSDEAGPGPARPHHPEQSRQHHPQTLSRGAVADPGSGPASGPAPGPDTAAQRAASQPNSATLIAALGRPAGAPAANPLQRRIPPDAKADTGAGFAAGFTAGARSGLGSGVIIAFALGLALLLLSPGTEQLTETTPATALAAPRH